MECRHSLSLSSVIGPPHSHFVNCPVVTERLTCAEAAIISANDAQVAPTFAKVTRINILLLRILQNFDFVFVCNLIHTFRLFYTQKIIVNLIINLRVERKKILII